MWCLVNYYYNLLKGCVSHFSSTDSQCVDLLPWRPVTPILSNSICTSNLAQVRCNGAYSNYIYVVTWEEIHKLTSQELWWGWIPSWNHKACLLYIIVTVKLEGKQFPLITRIYQIVTKLPNPNLLASQPLWESQALVVVLGEDWDSMNQCICHLRANYFKLKGWQRNKGGGSQQELEDWRGTEKMVW